MIHQLPSSAMATGPWEKTSGKYKFISTSRIVDALSASGFSPVKASQTNTRIPEKQGYTKHMIRFRSNSLIESTSSNALSVGDVIPELVLVNAHDGTSSLKFMLGLFRLVCSNGLTVAAAGIASISFKHIGLHSYGPTRDGFKDLNDLVHDRAFSIISQVPRIMNQVNRWKSKELDQSKQLEFAHRAADDLKLTSLDLDPSHLLDARRAADSSNDLWTVFNRVQENMIKGGLMAKNNKGKWRRTRRINSVNWDLDVNRGLWRIAESFENN
ncbi:MAG: DUF945 domain-containing protein [Clostridia bacterium]|nr:DUF945 domain-containing protein [Clostridia bacterium]